MEIPGSKPPTLGVVDPDMTIRIIERRPPCLRERFVVDVKKGRVHCSVCGREVDPYDALAALARHPENLRYEITSLTAERDRLQRETDDARRVRANAIAARKRAENPADKLLRELAEENRHVLCSSGTDKTCGRCVICRIRAVVNRKEGATE